MYVDEYLDDYVELKYITAHTNHSLGVVQLPHLALPKTIRGEVAMKISKGIQAERILEGIRGGSRICFKGRHNKYTPEDKCREEKTL